MRIANSPTNCQNGSDRNLKIRRSGCAHMTRAIPTSEKEGDMLEFISDAAGITEDDAVATASLITLDRHVADDMVLRAKTGGPKPTQGRRALPQNGDPTCAQLAHAFWPSAAPRVRSALDCA